MARADDPQVRDREIDFADAPMIWLTHDSGARKNLTVDRADFGIYRRKGNKGFELIDWF